ncbi:MAG: YbaN family protein [Bradyrhizobiaceae bacterium]|nr:YbaN family protein [Bradyrhizobiaceae bacterium]
MTRPLWIAIGLASLTTGAAGAVLPLLPSTPFLLLAAYAFARSSPRLHAWLLEHPAFGPVIDDWRRHRAIARRTKIAALAVIAATLALSALLGVSAWILAIQAVVLSGSAIFIVTRPDRPRAAPADE